VTAEQALEMGTAGGAALLGLPTGRIAAGMLADLVAVDLGHPSLHPPNALVKSVVYAMSHQAVTDAWVHGRHVVRDQRLTTVDQRAMLNRVRDLTKDWPAR
jgi:5-methylthioadenosine/S-adenosylhomocysteine deaminase